MFYNKLYFFISWLFHVIYIYYLQTFLSNIWRKNKELENTLTFAQDANFLTMIYPKISPTSRLNT